MKKKTLDNIKARDRRKKPAFKDDVQQMIDATKNALKKTKSEDIQIDDAEAENEDIGKESNQKTSKSGGEAQVSFFYTNDKYFLQFDDNEIAASIKEKYPNFMKEGISDANTKKEIVVMLQDKEFVSDLLEYYNMNIQDFFKFMFRLDTAIFRGPFLTKLQKIIQQNGYKI